MNCRHCVKQKRAFTLIELLVVISIIALLLSIMMPALSKAKAQAQAVGCLSNLKQIGMAFQLYAGDNRDRVVSGRFHNGGDWTSVNTWYSNLTPYLDTSQAKQDRVYLMSKTDAQMYNKVWTQLVCKAERRPVNRLYQGVQIRTYGANMACNYLPNTSFEDGYGLMDWGTGRTRRLNEVRNPSSVLAISDTRDIEYIGAGFTTGIKRQGENPEDYVPARYPGKTYCITFVDGHSGRVAESVLQAEKPQPNGIWRVF